MSSTEEEKGAQLRRYRRRVFLGMAVYFGLFMFVVEWIGRSGIADGVPVLSWYAAGPPTGRWLVGAIGKNALAGLMFGFLMSRMAHPKSPT
jgi:hypothetical protein